MGSAAGNMVMFHNSTAQTQYGASFGKVMDLMALAGPPTPHQFSDGDDSCSWVRVLTDGSP